jgi:hypothetical protein
MRKMLEPNPKDSRFVQEYIATYPQQAPAFAKSYIFPFTSDAFMNQIFEVPNNEYYFMLIQLEDDQTFRGACWEIVKAYPWYVIRYILRDVTFFLFRPGYTHTRYNVNPFSPEGLFFLPRTPDFAQEPIASRALRETQFDPLPLQPRIIQRAATLIGNWWVNLYHSMVIFTSILMVIAWASVGLCLVSKRMPSYKSSTIPVIFERQGLVGSITVVSVLLFYNLIVTAAFAEPNYRYHHFILLLRILLSGYGVVVLLWILFEPPIVLPQRCEHIPTYKRLKEGLSSLRSSDGLALVFSERKAHLAYLLTILVLILFTWWATFMVAHTS